MKSLEESILKIGIQNPLIVEERPDGKYLLVDGERRYRVATKLNLEKVPVTIHEPMSDVDRTLLRLGIQENNKSWGTFEKARAIAEIVTSTGMSSLEMAKILGMSQPTIDAYIQLLSISKRGRRAIDEYKIPYSYVRCLSKVSKKLQGSKREDFEEAFVHRVVQGEIPDTATATKICSMFSRNLDEREEGKEADMVELFMKGKSIDSLLKDSDIVEILERGQIITRAGSLKNALTKAMSKKRKVDAVLVEKLQRTVDAINKFVNR